MKKSLLFLIVATLFSTLANAQTISGTLTAASPVFNRPITGAPPTVLSGTGTSVYYSIITVNVTTAGSYTFSGSSAYDNYGILYNSSGFIPASPLTNAIEANDDVVGLNFAITETLAIGTYTLVFTTFSNGDTGPFSVTTTGPAAVALPLNLISFNGKSFSGYNHIEWATGSEKNTSMFELQRSNDGKEYAKVASIAAVGKGDNEYNQKDNNANGTLYYRLKMIDKDGQFTYSNNLKIVGKQSNEGLVTISPNPAKTNVNLTLANEELLGTEATIVNITGQTVHSFMIKESKMELNVAQYPAGIYLVKFSNGSLLRFTKQD